MKISWMATSAQCLSIKQKLLCWRITCRLTFFWCLTKWPTVPINILCISVLRDNPFSFLNFNFGQVSVKMNSRQQVYVWGMIWQQMLLASWFINDRMECNSQHLNLLNSKKSSNKSSWKRNFQMISFNKQTAKHVHNICTYKIHWTWLKKTSTSRELFLPSVLPYSPLLLHSYVYFHYS